MIYRLGPDILEDNPVILLDRLEIAGALALQTDITNIKARIFSYSSLENAKNDVDGTEQGTEISFVTSSTIFDTLQVDGMWPTAQDSRGYNMKLTIPAGRFSTPGYSRVEIKVTRSAVGEDPFNMPPWIMRVGPLASS